MKLKSIDPLTLKKRLDEGEAILIDVREVHEHAREHIEGARLAPLSSSTSRISANTARRRRCSIAKAARERTSTLGCCLRRASATPII
jgi:rhodanese-related sulfurtransferase